MPCFAPSFCVYNLIYWGYQSSARILKVHHYWHRESSGELLGGIYTGLMLLPQLCKPQHQYTKRVRKMFVDENSTKGKVTLMTSEQRQQQRLLLSSWWTQIGTDSGWYSAMRLAVTHRSS